MDTLNVAIFIVSDTLNLTWETPIPIIKSKNIKRKIRQVLQWIQYLEYLSFIAIQDHYTTCKKREQG